MNQSLFRKSSLWFSIQLAGQLLPLILFQVVADVSEDFLFYWLLFTPPIFIVFNAYCYKKQRLFRKEVASLTTGGRIWFSTIDVFSIGMIILWFVSLIALGIFWYYIQKVNS